MNRNIVVIEKDDSILDALTIILTNQGFNVKSSMSDEDALQTILNVKPCCTLIDIVRVSQDGTGLCRQLRKANATVPIIALSTQADAVTLKGIWADEVLLKPFDIDELIAAVEKQVHLFNDKQMLVV